MSFYGNITNTSRTHFLFDRIYSSRKEMDLRRDMDGIYAGRFVLVEYDTEMHMDSYLRISKIELKNGQELYYSVLGSDASASKETLLTKSKIHKNTIVYHSSLETKPTNGYYVKNCTFYKCTSDFVENSNEPATFVVITNEILDNPEVVNDLYVKNYLIDQGTYGRGYDSTVWLKVYVGGQEKYIMIAELNTVVPVFDLQADAPTQSPVTPHFDLNSSDLYYKLHYQPSWGFRIKGSRTESGPEFTQRGELTEITTFYSEDTPAIPYKSDEFTTWSRNEYNPDTGKLTTYYWHTHDTINTTYKHIGLISESDFNNSTYYIHEQNEYLKAQTWDKDTEYYLLIKIETGEWKEEIPENTKNTPAAIYYNKAGFSAEHISVDEDENYINITPTGKSGHQYGEHDKNHTNLLAQPDIQELSVMLPAIGTSVAKMWNIIYGDEIQNNGYERNLDIAWDSTEGLRLVKEKEDGNGFTYEPELMSTLAGSINAVHDLMGMIIKDENFSKEDLVKSTDNDHIYYIDGKYYRRNVNYKYTEAGPNEITTEYLLIGKLTEQEFSENVYYILTNDVYSIATQYDETYDYYTRKCTINENMTYNKINWNGFNEFPKNKYFYGGPSTYILETNDYPSHNRNYLTPLHAEDLFFTPIKLVDYDSILYYKIDNITINGEKESFSGMGYINGDPLNIIGTEYCLIRIESITTNKNNRPYAPNTYYLYVNEELKIGDAIPADLTGSELLLRLKLADGNFNSSYYYYAIEIDGYRNEVSIEKLRLYEPTQNHYYYIPSNSEIKLYLPCLDNEGNNLLTSNIIYDTNIEFCKLFEIEGTRTKHFYRPNTYYTANENKTEYTISADSYINPEILYFDIADNLISIELDPLIYQYGYADKPYEGNKYYISHKYYYQLDNKQFVVDRNLKPTNDRIYYLKENFLYVTTDYYDYFGIGAEWNPQILDVPPGIILSVREEVPELRELEGFARTLNTIHGLILKANQMLLIEDAYTRDNTTVQGTINLLNDIIHKFEIIAPGLIVAVDEYGRMHSMPYTTSLGYSAYNYGTKQIVLEYPESENRWINMEIDTNVREPLITIQHNITPAVNTTTSSNLNNEESSGDIDLYTPIVDNMGHVVGHNIETIELPHNFKHIKFGQDIITANTHLATLNINGDNWLNWTLDNDKLFLQLSHIGPVNNGTTIGLEKETTFKFGDTINIPAISYDSKGHIFNTKNIGATLPSLKCDDDSVNNRDLNGKIIYDIDSSKLIFTRKELSDVTLSGYNGTSTLIKATDTLGSALSIITSKIDTLSTKKYVDDTFTTKVNFNTLSGTVSTLSSTVNSLATKTALADLEKRVAALEKK